MERTFSSGDEIGEIVVDAGMESPELKKHFSALYRQAANDASLGDEARALAREGGVFELSTGENTLVVEGALLTVFGVAVLKGAGTAVGAIAVKELWTFFKIRLQDRDAASIHRVDDAAKRGQSD